MIAFVTACLTHSALRQLRVPFVYTLVRWEAFEQVGSRGSTRCPPGRGSLSACPALPLDRISFTNLAHSPGPTDPSLCDRMGNVHNLQIWSKLGGQGESRRVSGTAS